MISQKSSRFNRDKSQKYKKLLEPRTYSLEPNLGFTLVELLVVIAVIALVLAVVFPNFMGARQRARDTQRKNDLRQIQSSLELYKSDQNPQAYPTSGAFLGSCGTCWSSGSECGGNIYMRKIPCDPGGIAAYFYATPDPPDPFKYSLSVCLENLADPDRDPTPIPTCATSYTMHEP